MLITPCENGFGAFVEVTNRWALWSADSAIKLHNALSRFQVLVFPRVTTDLREFGRIARTLGKLIPHDFVSGLQEDNCIHEIRKNPDDVHNFGGTWHSDGAYLKRPPRTILLQALEVPNRGGDTLWACQFAAQIALSEHLSKTLKGCTVTHAAAPVFGGYADGCSMAIAQSSQHPLFRWVPDRREIALFHSGPCAQAIEGLTESESSSLLDEIMEVASTARTFRHSWRAGDVVAWDNRSTLHKALNDYSGQLRRMRRAMIGCETPRFPPDSLE